MNFTHPDQLYEVNRQKINKDKAFILKEEMLKPQSAFGVLFTALGGWMIAKGESLRKRHATTMRRNAPVLLQDQSSLFKA
jgi:hypothetical protein